MVNNNKWRDPREYIGKDAGMEQAKENVRGYENGEK